MNTKQIIEAIHAVDARIVEIGGERQSLDTKRQQALSADGAVSEAREALQFAKEELETQQSDSFISNSDVDLRPFIEAVRMAEKHLSKVSERAQAGRAALPRINQMLKDLAEEHASLISERKSRVLDYWQQLKRDEEQAFMVCLEELFTSIARIRAIDSHTHGEYIGLRLYQGIWRNNYDFCIPDGKGGIKRPVIRSFNFDQKVDAARAKFDATFAALIGASA